MDTQNQPITESNSLETPQDPIEQSGVVSAPEQSSGGIVTPSQNHQPEKPHEKLVLKKLFDKINIYLVLLIVILLILGGISYYAYQENRKAAKAGTLTTQKLTQDALDKLAGTDSTVGDAKQTLRVESNAIFIGGVVIRGNIDVAGTLKVGGPLSLPGLTVGGVTNLDQTAVKSFTDAGDATFQGKVSIQSGMSVSGNASFSGTVSAQQISADNLLLNKDLQLSHHILVNGGAPSRANGSALGGGGTASNSGTDSAGVVTINTGNGAPAGCFITLTFSQAYANIPHVVITPSSSAAAGMSYYVNRSSTTLSICTAGTPPSNTAGITFDYIVIG